MNNFILPASGSGKVSVTMPSVILEANPPIQFNLNPNNDSRKFGESITLAAGSNPTVFRIYGKDSAVVLEIPIKKGL